MILINSYRSFGQEISALSTLNIINSPFKIYPPLPNNASSSLYGRAKIAEYNGDVTSALSLFNQVIDSRSDKLSSALKDAAGLLHMVGRTDEAIEILKNNKSLISIGARRGFENLYKQLIEFKENNFQVSMSESMNNDFVMKVGNVKILPHTLSIEVIIQEPFFSSSNLSISAINLFISSYIPNHTRIMKIIFISSSSSFFLLLEFITHSAARKGMGFLKKNFSEDVKFFGTRILGGVSFSHLKSFWSCLNTGAFINKFTNSIEIIEEVKTPMIILSKIKSSQDEWKQNVWSIVSKTPILSESSHVIHNDELIIQHEQLVKSQTDPLFPSTPINSKLSKDKSRSIFENSAISNASTSFDFNNSNSFLSDDSTRFNLSILSSISSPSSMKFSKIEKSLVNEEFNLNIIDNEPYTPTSNESYLLSSKFFSTRTPSRIRQNSMYD